MKDSMIKAIEAQRSHLDANMFDNLIKVLNALVRGEQVLNLISVADHDQEEYYYEPSHYRDWYTMVTLASSDTWVFFPSIYAIIGKEILHTEHEDAEFTAMKPIHHWMISDTNAIEVSDVALNELDLVLKELDLIEGSMSSNVVKTSPVTYKGLAGLGELLNK